MIGDTTAYPVYFSDQIFNTLSIAAFKMPKPNILFQLLTYIKYIMQLKLHTFLRYIHNKSYRSNTVILSQSQCFPKPKPTTSKRWRSCTSVAGTHAVVMLLWGTVTYVVCGVTGNQQQQQTTFSINLTGKVVLIMMSCSNTWDAGCVPVLKYLSGVKILCPPSATINVVLPTVHKCFPTKHIWENKLFLGHRVEYS